MDALANSTVLLKLIEQLRKSGSWTGETHVQKAAFFLKELYDVPLPAEFVVYKYGPFSFDLRDQLVHLRTTGHIRTEPQPGYGPKLGLTEVGTELLGRYHWKWKDYDAAIAAATEWLAGKSVQDLERLATAWYVHRREPGLSDDTKIGHIRTLKPHVTEEQAQRALQEATAQHEGRAVFQSVG